MELDSGRQRLVRSAGLKAEGCLRLEDIDRRRSQLWALTLALLVLLAALYAAVTGLGPEVGEGTATVRTLRIALPVLVLAFGGYVLEREHYLRRLAQMLVDERVLSGMLAGRVRELASLAEAAKVVNSTLDLPAVLDTILSAACDLLSAQRGSIQLVEERDTGTLVVAAARGLPADALGQRQPVGEGIAGRVAEQRDPRLVVGHADDAFVQPDREVGSSLSVPLVSREELVGVLNISSGTEQQAFTEFQLRSLSVFAESAAAAIRNARMSGVQLLAVRRLEELDQLKNEFLATVTHELRTPLASIIGAGQALGRRMDVLPPEVARDLIGIVEAQGVRMSKMVEELLRTAEISSRRFSLDLSPVDLTEMIKSVVEAVQLTSDKHRVELEVADPATVDGDRAALERVFTNLVENAIKYSPAGGGVGVGVSRQGSVVLARVTDHGTGIPPDRVAEIFEPFRRAAPGKFGGGLGLGLFIARSIIEAHGGSIEVDSAVGEGSTFSVTLPVHAPGTANGVTGIKVPEAGEVSEIADSA